MSPWGESKIVCTTQLASISPWAENFTTVKIGGVSSRRGEIFFSVLVVSTLRILTTDRVEFTPGRIRIIDKQIFNEVAIKLLSICLDVS